MVRNVARDLAGPALLSGLAAGGLLVSAALHGIAVADMLPWAALGFLWGLGVLRQIAP